jgi:hypothetical protein
MIATQHHVKLQFVTRRVMPTENAKYHRRAHAQPLAVLIFSEVLWMNNMANWQDSQQRRQLTAQFQ